jgi:hypothetical protein
MDLMEGASSSGIPLQGVSSCSKRIEGRDLKLEASGKLGRLHLGRSSCLEIPGGSPKARAREGGTEGIQQMRCVITPEPKQPYMSYVSMRIQLN